MKRPSATLSINFAKRRKTEMMRIAKVVFLLVTVVWASNTFAQSGGAPLNIFGYFQIVLIDKCRGHNYLKHIRENWN